MVAYVAEERSSIATVARSSVRTTPVLLHELEDRWPLNGQIHPESLDAARDAEDGDGATSEEVANVIDCRVFWDQIDLAGPRSETRMEGWRLEGCQVAGQRCEEVRVSGYRASIPLQYDSPHCCLRPRTPPPRMCRLRSPVEAPDPRLCGGVRARYKGGLRRQSRQVERVEHGVEGAVGRVEADDRPRRAARLIDGEVALVGGQTRLQQRAREGRGVGEGVGAAASLRHAPGA